MSEIKKQGLEARLVDLFWEGLSDYTSDAWFDSSSNEKEEILWWALDKIDEPVDKDYALEIFWMWADGLEEDSFVSFNSFDEKAIKGVRTITVHNDTGTKVVLDFKTFEEAAKHFDDLYVNAVEDNYAEEVLFPILLAAQNEEYDYIDEDGYAVIEQDATGIFEGCDSAKEATATELTESYRRIISRGNLLIDNELFVDFE